MELYLDYDGRTLHLTTCRWAETKRRWRWADHRTPGDVFAAIKRHGYAMCDECGAAGR